MKQGRRKWSLFGEYLPIVVLPERPSSLRLNETERRYHCRFGSCGGLAPSLPVGSLVVPKASIGVTRNYDFDFLAARADAEQAYRISKPVC